MKDKIKVFCRSPNLFVPCDALCIVAAIIDDAGLKGRYEIYNVSALPVVDSKIFNITSKCEISVGEAYSIDDLLEMGEEYAKASLHFQYWTMRDKQAEFSSSLPGSLREMTASESFQLTNEQQVEIAKIREATSSMNLKSYLQDVVRFKWFFHPKCND